MISDKWGEADSVARLKMDPKVAQVGPRGPKFGPHSSVFFDHDECMHWGPGEKLQTSSEK